MMSDEPLPHLATFIQAAELASFTAAARVLGITQAAVSQRVHQLEAILRIGLFQRRFGRITLTSAGRKLYEYARRIVELHAEARTAIADLEPDLCGELVIAASSIPGSHLLPPSLATFRRTYPDVNVRVRISDSDDVLRLVEVGEADLGFAGDSVVSRHLVFERFAGDELAVVIPVNHRFGGRRRIALRDFVREPLIQRENGSGSRRCLERALRSVGQDPGELKTVLEVGGNEAIKDAVLQGVGLAVLSRRSVHHEVFNGTIRVLSVTGLNLARDLFLVRDRRRQLSTAAQTFLSHLRSTAVSTS
jgi:DNA-binding transcriptional LysR family regulator